MVSRPTIRLVQLVAESCSWYLKFTVLCQDHHITVCCTCLAVLVHHVGMSPKGNYRAVFWGPIPG